MSAVVIRAWSIGGQVRRTAPAKTTICTKRPANIAAKQTQRKPTGWQENHYCFQWRPIKSKAGDIEYVRMRYMTSMSWWSITREKGFREMWKLEAIQDSITIIIRGESIREVSISIWRDVSPTHRLKSRSHRGFYVCGSRHYIIQFDTFGCCQRSD